MQRHVACAMLAGLFAVVANPHPASAQQSRPFQRLTEFFRKDPEPVQKTAQESPSRVLEILVELAWMNDPATFPYYLQARVQGSVMHVRGNVPSSTIRDRALRIAQLHCPLALSDGLRENPNLVARPRRMAPSQLESAAQTALREILPKHHHRLTVKVNAEGRIVIGGMVANFESKLAVSQSLRRLHGCTSIANMLDVASDPGGHMARQIATRNSQVRPASGRPATQGQLTSRKGNTNAYPPPSQQVNNRLPTITNKYEEPTAQIPGEQTPQGPTQGVVVVPNSPPQNSVRLTPLQVRKIIEGSCPTARGVQVKFTSPTEMRVDVQVPKVDDGDRVAGEIFGLQQLQPYRVDLHIQVSEQKQ